MYIRAGTSNAFDKTVSRISIQASWQQL